MANDLNRCDFIGRLGNDVDIKYMQDGKGIANFSIAVGWKTTEREGTEWINITAFGKLADICGKYLSKGSKVYISGRFKTDKWQDKDGKDRYTTKIIADKLQMLDSLPAKEAKQDNHNEAKSNGYAPQNDDFDDDIPF